MKTVHLRAPVASRVVIRVGALCLSFLVLAVRPSAAQAVVTAAALTGSVDDPSGAAIDGAQLSATNLESAQRWTTASGPDGRYRFMSLPPGDYRVEAVHDGFQAQTTRVTLTAGRALDVPLHLKVAGPSESVSVRADLRVVDVARTQAAESVSPAEIEGLPLNGRNYLDLALLAPGASRTNTRSTERYSETSAVPGTGLSINGQRNLSNTFLVDGLSANDDAAGLSGVYLSEEVIREFQVVNAGGVAEFGRTGSGAVSVVTQSGSEHLRGRSYWYGRHGRLDARNPLAVRKDPLSQSQYGLTLGGPLPIARTFAFGNLEQVRQQRRGLVTIAEEAIAAIDTALDRYGFRGPRPQSGDYPTGDDTTNVFVKLDHQRAGGARLTGRYTLYSLSSANARGAGGLNDASRGTALENIDQSWSASMVAPLSSRLLNEARAQVMRGRLAAPPNDLAGPAVNISGVANFGMATSSPTARDADVYQAADSVSWQRGSHLVKGGVDVIWNRVTIAFPGALRGAYTFSSLANLAVGRYISYQQAFGSASQFQSNPNLGLFAQDEWRLRRDLTVNAGVRYDRQWLPKPIDADTGDVSPRLGVAWAPGSRRTVVRAGAGLFYDRLPLRAVSNALQRDGVRYKVAILSFGQAGAPPFPMVLDAFPASALSAVTTMAPNVRHGRSAQASVQVERQLGQSSSAALGYVHLDGGLILMSRNVNVPTLTAAQGAALGIPNLGRPNPEYGNINRYEAIGESRYDGVTASFTWRSTRWGQLRAAYTLSKALDDAGNFFFSAPQDNADVRADWGPSDNDQRHRVVLSGLHATGRPGGGGVWRRLAADWQCAYIFSYGSPLPFNVQTGTDRNNDTTVNDRPTGVGRNTGRGFTTAALDLRLSRRFSLKERVGIEVIAEAFNVLNRANLQIPNNIIGAGPKPLPTFGQATAAGDARQFQVGLRATF